MGRARGLADMKRGPSGPLLSSSCSALGRALVRLTPVETALCRTLQRFRYLSLLGEDFKRIVRSPSRLATPWWGESTRLRSSPPPSCRLPQKTVGRPLPMPRSIVPRPCWGERRRLTIHHGSCIGGAPFIVRGRTHDHPTPTQSPAVEAGWLPRSRSRTRARSGSSTSPVRRLARPWGPDGCAPGDAGAARLGAPAGVRPAVRPRSRHRRRKSASYIRRVRGRAAHPAAGRRLRRSSVPGRSGAHRRDHRAAGRAAHEVAPARRAMASCSGCTCRRRRA